MGANGKDWNLGEHSEQKNRMSEANSELLLILLFLNSRKY